MYGVPVEAGQVLAGAVLLSLVHAVVPNHWLPFVVVGRSQGWTQARTLTILLLAGGVHLLVALLLGVVFAWLGSEIVERVEGATHLVAGGSLLAVGGLYLGLGVAGRSGHGEVHRVPESVAVGGLFLAMAFSPCEALLPMFFAASPYGWRTILVLGAVTSVATAVGMLLLTFLALRGAERFHFHWLEQHERVVMGAILVGVGALLFLE